MQNLETTLLLEGLSSNARNFHALIKKILMASPIRLLKLVMAPSEGVMDFGFVTEDTTPKGETAEVARGKTHRAIMVRFPTTDGANMLLFFVIPLVDLAGKEITDQKALSSIQRKLKAIHADLIKGVPGTEIELDAVYKDKAGAVAKLREIDQEIVMAGENPAHIIQRDPVRHALGQLIARFYPDHAKKYVATLAALERGTIENKLQTFSWNASNIPIMTRMAATVVANRDVEDPQTVKLTAGLALACMTTEILDSEDM